MPPRRRCRRLPRSARIFGSASGHPLFHGGTSAITTSNPAAFPSWRWRRPATRTDARWSCSPSPTATPPDGRCPFRSGASCKASGPRSSPSSSSRFAASRSPPTASARMAALHSAQGDGASPRPLAGGEGRRTDRDRRAGGAQSRSPAEDCAPGDRIVLRQLARAACERGEDGVPRGRPRGARGAARPGGVTGSSAVPPRKRRTGERESCRGVPSRCCRGGALATTTT